MNNPLNTYDLSKRQGIVYKITFGSGHYYYGITKRTFKRRYATKTLSKGCPQVVEAAKTGWDAVVLCDGMGWEELSEIESLIVNEETISDPMCINKHEGGRYYQKKWDGAHRTAIRLVDPEGKLHLFKSHSEAAEHIGCGRPSVTKLKSGENKSVYGWYMPEVGKPKRKMKRSKKVFSIEKDGVVMSFNSVEKAAKYVNCNRTSMFNVIYPKKGKGKSVYGWKLHEITY